MKRLYTILFIVCCISKIIHAQVAVTEIPGLHKLPVNAIHRIFQDSEGYMWYGTVNGLCRDDGYQIQIFRSDFNHPGLLANNLIECITEDGEGNIWFGTDKGAYKLNKKNYSVHPVAHPLLNHRIIHQMYRTQDGNIWISTAGYLLKYTPEGRCIKCYQINNGDRPTNLSGFCEGRNGDIIMSFSKGLLYRLDQEKDSMIPFPDKMRRHNPGCIIQDNEHEYYWVGTWGDGIIRFDPDASPDSMYSYPHTSETDSPQNKILYLTQDRQQNRLWATSITGLSAFDIQNRQLIAHQPEKAPLYTSRVMLNDIIRDHIGNIWVSAFNTSSFILHFQSDAPQEYSLPSLYNKTHYQPTVMTLCDCGNNILWLFQERTGIFLYDLSSHQTSFHKDFPETRTLPVTLIKIMTESHSDNGVWVAPEFSLNIFRLGHQQMQMKLLKRLSLQKYPSHKYITALYEDKEGKNLWIGTCKGLLQFDLSQNKMTEIFDTLGHVTQIISSPNHTVWACTYNKGVYSVSPQGKVTHYPLSQALSCLTQTSDGTLWLGSDEGDLLSLDPHHTTVKNYNATCHLQGNMISKVMADEFNHIWIGTNQKIIEFNPHNGSFRTYLTTDGSMNLWRIIPTALCKGKDGNIYFGGIPGICRFTPSNTLEREAHPAKTVISDIKTNGASFFFDKNQSYPSDSIIRVSSECRNLTICFSSLNHRIAHKIRYAYRLRGFEDEWQYTSDGQNTAIYNQLPKGSYTFEVKATDENGQWSNQVTTLRIRRLPAYYETWWAYLIYTTLFLALSGYCIFWYVGRIKKKMKNYGQTAPN